MTLLLLQGVSVKSGLTSFNEVDNSYVHNYYPEGDTLGTAA